MRLRLDLRSWPRQLPNVCARVWSETLTKAGPRRVCFGPASFLRPWRYASRPVTDGNGEQDQDERGERLSAGTVRPFRRGLPVVDSPTFPGSTAPSGSSGFRTPPWRPGGHERWPLRGRPYSGRGRWSPAGLVNDPCPALRPDNPGGQLAYRSRRYDLRFRWSVSHPGAARSHGPVWRPDDRRGAS